MAAHRIPAYDEKAHRGLLRHFYVRTNRKGQSLCAVIANGEALPQEAAPVQALRQAEPNPEVQFSFYFLIVVVLVFLSKPLHKTRHICPCGFV